MRRAGLVLCVWVLFGSAACGSSAPSILDVIVEQEGLMVRPDELDLTLTLDGDDQTERFPVPQAGLPGVISATLPGGTEGPMPVKVTAYLGVDRVAFGEGQARLIAGAHATLTVTVRPVMPDG